MLLDEAYEFGETAVAFDVFDEFDDFFGVVLAGEVVVFDVEVEAEDFEFGGAEFLGEGLAELAAVGFLAGFWAGEGVLG